MAEPYPHTPNEKDYRSCLCRASKDPRTEPGGRQCTSKRRDQQQLNF